MHERHPFWQVQTVFDPDGEGSDFGYTIGLATRGVPELHLWGRPSLGDDPGDDWKFSSRDTCRILNDAAWKWLDGRLRVGDTFEQEYDDGYVTVRFQVDPPQDPDSLDAFGARGSLVVPIRWSLHRPPLGPPRQMTEDQRMQADERWSELVKDLDLARPAPPGCALPVSPSWSGDQKYGPRTPLVLALVARLWQADVDDLGGLVQVGAYVDLAASLTGSISVSATAARTVGRADAVARIVADVHALADDLGRRWLRRPFAAMQLEVMGEARSPRERSRHAESLRHLLADVTSGAACSEAVADVLPASAVMAGLGPFLAGFRGPGDAPGPEWIAPQHVVAQVRRCLSALAPATLAQVAFAHLRARDDPAYHEVFAWLSARAVTSSASAPDILSLLRPDVATTTYEALRGAGLLGMLQEWTSALVAALVHGETLGPSRTDVWVRPYEGLLPGLRRELASQDVT